MKSRSNGEELKACRIEQFILQASGGKITWLQAAKHVGLSARQLRRWRRRYQQFGSDGLIDRRVGKRSPRRIPTEQCSRVLELFHEEYAGLNVRAVSRQTRTSARNSFELHLGQDHASGPGTHKQAHQTAKPPKDLGGHAGIVKINAGQ
jgi:transposase